MSGCKHDRTLINNDGSIFCRRCGEELRTAEEAAELQAAYDEEWGR